MGTVNTGDNLDREIRRQQIAVLVRQSPLLAIINLANALLIGVVIWDAVPSVYALVWATAVTAIAVYPLRTWLKSRRHGELKAGIGSGGQRAVRRATIQAAMAGLIWAAAAPLFAPHLDSEQLLFLSLVLTGMCCGGAIVLSAIPMAAVAYAAPGMIAVVTMFIALGDPTIAMLGVMVLLFLCAVVYVVRLALTDAIENFRERMVVAEQRALYQERFRDFAETASDWMWESDGDGEFTYRSEGVSETEAQPIRLLLQGSPTASEFMTRIDRHDELSAAVRRHQPFRDFEYRLWDADGAEMFLAVSGRPRLSTEGTFLGYRGTAANITERVAHARQLEQAQKELSAMVKETETAYVELERKHRDLEEANYEVGIARDQAVLANQSKSAFLANMSHELRTPLNAIIGFSQLIADEALGPISEPAHRDTYIEYARDVLTSGRYLLDIINDILDLSQLEVGKLELKEDDTLITDVADAAVRLMRERARANGLSLDVDLSEVAGVRLFADPTKVKQILINLLSNAVKFTPRGGTIRISGRLSTDQGAVFEIADTGIGMTADELERATQPFVQGDSIYHKRFAGAGLGLSISKALTEMHEATLHLASTPENGTTVCVNFPANRVHRVDGGDHDAKPHAAVTHATP